MEKSCRKCAPKASLRSLLILLNNPKQPFIKENILKVRYFERGLSRSLKKTFFEPN